MSRYINYDDIDYRNDKMHDKSSEFLDGVIYMAQRIEEAPTIDIVRCKECRYYHQLYGCQKHDDIDLVTNDDDYCSYGERKE